MENRTWWREPMRVIQTNLQVKDTPKMDPARIAQETADMGANVLVINAGGIYAWYPSRVPFHHINEYLPDYDLLEALIGECHARNIRVVARFDFSKAEDAVFQMRPWWFVRDGEGKPTIYGKDRPGPWSLLYTTCINGGYRNGEVAVPVLEEVVGSYGVDGVFFNAPQYEPCHCQACQNKYRQVYGKPLPETGPLEPGWPSLCVKENVGLLYATIKRVRDIPVILYYSPYARPQENLEDRLATADLLCTEAQDVLSRGVKDIPQPWRPALSMKVGNLPGREQPFGIIHSCPGMDWRHTGLPTAEYRFWMSQIPANAGTIWHSITGFGDTISDKRILESVSFINHQIVKCEKDMYGARSLAQALLLWDAQDAAIGWAEGLVRARIPFDLTDAYHLTADKLAGYPLVVLPEGYALEGQAAALLKDYLRAGGRLIAEGTRENAVAPLREALGMEAGMATSEPLAASYLRLEDPALHRGLERTPLLPHRGVVGYARPAPGAHVLATLVPPFAPLDAVGAPPERASLLVERSDLPLILRYAYGQGESVFLCFQLSALLRQYRLPEHDQLLRNLVDSALGARKRLEVEAAPGVQAMVYGKGGDVLVHLVNGVGERPLAACVPVSARIRLRLEPGQRLRAVDAVLSGEPIAFTQRDGWVEAELPALKVWEMAAFRFDL